MKSSVHCSEKEASILIVIFTTRIKIVVGVVVSVVVAAAIVQLFTVNN